MPNLITLTGPSQAGKSTAIKLFKKYQNDNFKPVPIPKFTTRPPREDDDPSEVITVKVLTGSLDLVYQQYDSRYGLSSMKILEQMKTGYSPILVLNDVRLITEVKRLFGSLTRSIFLFRKNPNIDQFIDDAKLRGDDITEETHKRFKKAEAIYRIYIENIFLFDHVLLNAGTPKTLDVQISTIVKGLSSINNPLLK